MANDDVTAVIACFNYGRYLREAVDSVLAQGARVVVVDDGSTDPGTHAVLDELAVEVVRQENRGVCAARNAGLALVDTPYAIVVDADDRLAPGALDAMRAPLDADPALGFPLMAAKVLRPKALRTSFAFPATRNMPIMDASVELRKFIDDGRIDVRDLDPDTRTFVNMAPR